MIWKIKRVYNLYCDLRKQSFKNCLCEYDAWYRWFAWYPVKVDNGKYIWLRIIFRRNGHRHVIRNKEIIIRFREYKECIFDFL